MLKAFLLTAQNRPIGACSSLARLSWRASTAYGTLLSPADDSGSQKVQALAKGPGSECVSAALAGRRIIAYEKEEQYYKLILRRMRGFEQHRHEMRVE